MVFYENWLAMHSEYPLSLTVFHSRKRTIKTEKACYKNIKKILLLKDAFSKSVLFLKECAVSYKIKWVYKHGKNMHLSGKMFPR